MDDRLHVFVDAIAERANAEPDLDDFLTWTAGTLEYWLHIIASSVGRRMGWASTTEVPYVTGCPAANAKSDTKWADGAILLRDGLGILLEVKTVPAWGSVPGPTIKKVAADFAALLSADWSRTLALPADRYAGQRWIVQRSRMTSVCGLQLLLLHGECDPARIDAEARKGIAAGVAALAYRYRRADEPTWMARLREAMLEREPVRYDIGSDGAQATLFAWAAPIVATQTA